MISAELAQLQEHMEAASRYVKSENDFTLANSKLLQKKIAVEEEEKVAKTEQLSKLEEDLKSLKKNIADQRKGLFL